MLTSSAHYLKRCWAPIDLDSLTFNLEQIKKQLPSHTEVMAVVKADAYGHGDKMIAKTLIENGVDFLAVSNIEEAIGLREGDLEGNPLTTSRGAAPLILVLGYTPEAHAKMLYENNICQTVYSLEYAHRLNDICARLGIKLTVHIKIDTGMNRLGIPHRDEIFAADAVAEIIALPFLDVAGIFTHLSSADSPDNSDLAYTRIQIKRFRHLKAMTSKMGIDIPLWHIQNSAGIAFCEEQQEEAAWEYARAGIVLYGLPPGEAVLPFTVKPVMSIKTVVSHIKELEGGQPVSYGRRYVSNGNTMVATLPIGYADGYFRILSGKAEVIIKGQRALVIGNICMDQLMVDVTGISGISIGEEVTVVGKEGEEEITFEELAHKANTIPYELICAICKRVPRVYIKGGIQIAATARPDNIMA